jgi:peptide deformylase
MIVPIAKLPSKILRAPTKDLDLPVKKNTMRMIKDMVDTVRSADGVGLAAPQIGKDLNMALIYLEEMGLPAFPIINPTITKYSKEMTEMEEGCLSMPGVFGMVKRPKKITVEAYNLDGEKFVITDDTFLARVIQHEVDHLHCTLIADRIYKITKGEELLPKFGLNIKDYQQT